MTMYGPLGEMPALTYEQLHAIHWAAPCEQYVGCENAATHHEDGVPICGRCSEWLERYR